MFLCSFVFFVKQKTAYEMRISDWSSDVCSSDLVASLDQLDEAALRAHAAPARGGRPVVLLRSCGLADRGDGSGHDLVDHLVEDDQRLVAGHRHEGFVERRVGGAERRGIVEGLLLLVDQLPQALGGRSEEHQSELQSLMRISSAVLCLKK